MTILDKQNDDAKDAARYRWLNKQHNFLIYIEDEKMERQNVRLRCGIALDEWIDRRIQQEGDDAAHGDKIKEG